MSSFLRQTNAIPGVDTHGCMEKWKDYSLDKLMEEERKLQSIYFTMRGNPSLENQARIILEQLQKYIQTRYKKEDKKNQKKINL